MALLSLKEAAKELGVTKKWLQEQCRLEKVPHRKIGRYRKFTPEDIAEYLERQKLGRDPWQRSPQAESKRRNRGA